MNYMTSVRKRAAIRTGECVACGTCVKLCPLGLISIDRGLYAQLDARRCVGCGKCARGCPASVIEILMPEEVAHGEA